MADVLGTVIVEGDSDREALTARLSYLNEQPQNLVVACNGDDEAAVSQVLRDQFPHIERHVAEGFLPANLSDLLPAVTTEFLAFLPAELPRAQPPWSRLGPNSLMPWLAETTFPEAESTPGEFLARGWLAATRLLREPTQRGAEFTWDPLSIGRANQDLGLPVI